jgi:hypothetical protein
MCEVEQIVKIAMYWVCPSCGHKNRTIEPISTVTGWHDFLVYCDSEEGGCDRKQFVRAEIEVKTQVFQVDYDNLLPTFRDRADLEEKPD